MKRVIISRAFGNKKQTLGQLHVISGDRSIFSCDTLELPDLQNEPRVSRIPEGNYCVVKRSSAKFAQHFHILNVPNRSYILIHKGNFYTDILGCVLVGDGLREINGDGEMDVVNSNKTMKKLLSILPSEFELEIK